MRCRGASLNPSTLQEASALATEATSIGSTASPAATVDAVWAAAIVDIMTSGGRAAPVRRAADRLTDVASRLETNADALNDLAIAHLIAGSDRRDAVELFRALNAIERSALIDTSSRTTLFNRALILQRLFLDREAEVAWERYLEKDSSSAWAIEAHSQSAALRHARKRPTFREILDNGRHDVPRDAQGWSQLVSQDSQGAREYVLDVLLAKWADAIISDDAPRAGSFMRTAASLGMALATTSNDSSMLHVVRVFSKLTASGASPQELARATAEFARGAAMFRRGDIRAAGPILEHATARLSRLDARSLGGWAEILLSATEVYRARYRVANDRFVVVARAARERGDLALQARATWGLGLSFARQGRTGDAESQYAEALAIFERIGERSNYASMHSQLADVLFLQGRDALAYLSEYRALAAMRDRDAPRERHSLLLALGQELSDGSLPFAAVAVQREAVSRSIATERPKDHAEALALLGRAQADAGEHAAARRSLAAAGSALMSVDDEISRDRVRMEIAAAEARVFAPSTPKVARERLTEVERYFETNGIPIQRGPVLVRRARLALQLADSAAAEADLATAVRLLEAQAESEALPATIRELLDARRDVFRQLVEIHLARHDTVAAFAYAERGRTRSGHRPEIALDRLRGSVPASTVVLGYTLLSKGVISWVVTSTGFRVIYGAADENNLRERIHEFSTLIQRDDDPAKTHVAARALYNLLVLPALGDSVDAREVVLVPDGVLAQLPFAALRDPHDRYLVERTSIRYASSLADWAGSEGGHPGTIRATASPLLIADPAFDRALFPELDVLRSAEREVTEVSNVYQKSVIVRDVDASKATILSKLAATTLLHFAGHARVVESTPNLSHLVLARTPGGFPANVLYGFEIARLDLQRIRLVVLSACGTTRQLIGRGESTRELSQAFLQAGAGAVVSSLWEADDDATASLMGEFHRALASGRLGSEALRAAQLRMLRPGSPYQSPRVWSGFRYEGI